MAGGGNPDNCVVTAVSRFTEQVSSMGERIPKHNNHSLTPL